VVDVDGDVDFVAEARERFVDRIVDDLVDEMVQPRDTGGPDVHCGTLPNGLEPLEDFDLVSPVLLGVFELSVSIAAALRHERTYGVCAALVERRLRFVGITL